MKTLAIASVALLLSALPLAANESVGGFTGEQCAAITVTTGSAYTAGNSVGGLITINRAMLSVGTGVLQSVRLNFGETQSAEFDVSIFKTAPAGTFTDKSTPAITAADALLVLPPIKLTANSSLLGSNGTVYGLDGIARAFAPGTTSVNLVITTPGTPTFNNAHPQICVGILQDWP